MSDPDQIIAALSAPFPPDQVTWRVGPTTKDKSKGIALAYIDARDVMVRLDEVVGAANWQSRYPHAGAKTVCDLGIRIDGEWIWKSNGAGDTDMEGTKGALSDAFKRAAVLWGIGRYLYDIDSPWVALTGEGKFVKIDPKEFKRLRALLPGAPAGKSNKRDPEYREKFHNMSRDLDACEMLEDVDVILDRHAQTIADMPADWKPAWRERVRLRREKLQPAESQGVAA